MLSADSLGLKTPESESSAETEVVQDENGIETEEQREQPIFGTAKTEEPADAPGKVAWDKERQRAEQAEANYRKALKQFGAVGQQYEQGMAEMQRRLDTITEQLTSIKTVKEDDGLGELDPSLIDPSVIKHISNLRLKLDGLSKRYAESERKIAQYEEQEGTKAVETRKQQTVEKILKPLDEEYGAKFRKQAIELADKLINDGEIDQPTDALEASQLMRKCYGKVKQQLDSKKTTAVATDSGKGAVEIKEATSKPGKLNDVWNEMRKAGKFK